MADAGKVLNVFDINGRVVGTVVSTGDDFEDIKLAHQVFERLGLNSPQLTEAQSIFEHALSFYKATHVLFGVATTLGVRSKYFLAPLAVNSTFAIELHLKAIAKQHAISLHGHKLLILYQGLPAPVISRIESLANLVVADHDVPSIDLKLFLSNLNDAFVRWRYAHEFEGSHFQLKQAMFLLDLFNRFAETEIPEASRADR